jgi:hypothetical protein
VVCGFRAVLVCMHTPCYFLFACLFDEVFMFLLPGEKERDGGIRFRREIWWHFNSAHRRRSRVSLQRIGADHTTLGMHG